jgi:SAM-dependent methyltransferase
MDMNNWTPYLQRYQGGEWRTPIFRDLLLQELHRLPSRPTLLDIGCGAGFDGDLEMQHELAGAAGEYLGIEPDPAVPLGAHFTRTWRCRFEEAPIPPASVDLAFAVMVLEHLTTPRQFWDRLWEVLRPGGIFWGFTVDARHWFCQASLLLKKLRIKDLYLHRLLQHQEGETDYNNYPVYYRANSPDQVLPLVKRFARCDFLNFVRVGQLDYYLPRFLHGVNARLDCSLMARGKPGAILAIRLAKAPITNGHSSSEKSLSRISNESAGKNLTSRARSKR